MESMREMQQEALQTLMEFNPKVVKNMEIVAGELSGEKLPDTDELLKSVVDAVNWEIQVLNATMDFINDGKERVSKEAMNEKMLSFGEALKEKNDSSITEALKNLMPEFENLGKAVEEVLA